MPKEFASAVRIVAGYLISAAIIAGGRYLDQNWIMWVGVFLFAENILNQMLARYCRALLRETEARIHEATAINRRETAAAIGAVYEAVQKARDDIHRFASR